MPYYFDLSSLKPEEFAKIAEAVSPEQRRAAVLQKTVSWKSNNILHKPNLGPNDVLRQEEMSFYEEMICFLLFLFGVPGAVFSFPVLFCLIGLVFPEVGVLKALMYGGCISLPLVFYSVGFQEKNLYSWSSIQILRYFSFKVIFDDFVPHERPSILVAPPHGVFPFGNIVTMLAFPSVMGYSFSGIASDAVFRTPMFKQMLEWIGCISASRENVSAVLRGGGVVGISTGGVAEVFETDADQDDGEGDECVVLMERKGLVKLAIINGADIVPCYLFGNSKLLSLFTGGAFKGVLTWISRKIKFATILFWGRLFLPVPYRQPILGVLAKPIPTVKNPDPSKEEIEKYHTLMINSMRKLFDEHKGYYGWNKKRLVIK